MRAEPTKSAVTALDLVQLATLMDRTRGVPEITIGLIDGPVARDHPDLAQSAIRELPNTVGASCKRSGSFACLHGTFVAGILSARRGCDAPAICPGCTLLVRPIFSEITSAKEHLPSANPDELATAILECIDAGARVINLSLALAQPSMRSERMLQAALDHALLRGVLIIAAAGNQNMFGSTVMTRHPWVIPVVACDGQGLPSAYSNFGRSIGTRGLRARGDGVISLSSNGPAFACTGTSVATPFVTGAVALLWSVFPTTTAQKVKVAVTQAVKRRAGLVPPLLDAAAAYQALATENSRM